MPCPAYLSYQRARGKKERSGKEFCVQDVCLYVIVRISCVTGKQRDMQNKTTPTALPVGHGRHSILFACGNTDAFQSHPADWHAVMLTEAPVHGCRHQVHRL